VTIHPEASIRNRLRSALLHRTTACSIQKEVDSNCESLWTFIYAPDYESYDTRTPELKISGKCRESTLSVSPFVGRSRTEFGQRRMSLLWGVSESIKFECQNHRDFGSDISSLFSRNTMRAFGGRFTATKRRLPAWLRQMMILAVSSIFATVNSSGDVQSISQTLAASVASFGKLSVPATTTLRSASTRFDANLSGTLMVSYWARTSDSGGGSISMQASSEFSPSGGPSVSTVTYLCSGATLGSSCSGVQTLTTSSQTPVVSLPANACTGGGGPCSTQDPNTVLLTLSAPNKPKYKTGTYSTVITFTISTI